MYIRNRIDLSYDGTEYAGWQIQPDAVTIQQRLQECLLKLTGQKVIVHGSGRTDQGVHARRQTAHFDMPAGSRINLKKALNALLPPDIRIHKAHKEHEQFHARLSASSKEYRYFIWNSDVVPPFVYRYRTRIPYRLDIKKMNIAAGQLAGEHDFRAFSVNPDRPVDSYVREIYKIDVSKHGNEIILKIEGNGFLYKMVRSIAGYLIRVGEGALRPEMTNDILTDKKRTNLFPTAPPKGLFLWRVIY